MKFKTHPIKPLGLSDKEKAALRGVAGGAIVEPSLCMRLKTLGLVKQIRGGWELTQQGHIRLMFQGAR